MENGWSFLPRVDLCFVDLEAKDEHNKVGDDSSGASLGDSVGWC